MAKDKERIIAKEYYVDQGLTAKAIAEKGLATEQTISRWVNQFGWKKLRDAKNNSIDKRTERIAQVIETLTEQRIQLFEKIKEAKLMDDDYSVAQLQKEAVEIDNAIGKWNKSIETLNKEGKITLTVYVEVMEDIFRTMNIYDAGLHQKTLDFQEEHLNTISLKLL